MTDPIIAALIGVVAVVGIALGSVFYRFGRLTGMLEQMRRESTLRHTDLKRQATERYEGIVRRLERLEGHMINRSMGDGDD